MADHIVRALTARGAARVVAAVTCDTTAEAARRHGLSATAEIVLGQGLSAALLLATLTKGGERVTLQISGDGALGGVVVDADDGRARGYVRRPAGRGGPLLGSGLVTVIRDLGPGEQYVGQAELRADSIDQAVEHYLRTSEQIDSALGCAVFAGGQPAAGGVLAQCLPGGAEAVVAAARERLRGGVLTRDALADARKIVAAVLGGAPFEVLDIRPVRFFCPCSRERVADALALCGEAEIAGMIREDRGAEVTCQFCGQRYNLGREELLQIRGGWV